MTTPATDTTVTIRTIAAVLGAVVGQGVRPGEEDTLEKAILRKIEHLQTEIEHLKRPRPPKGDDAYTYFGGH